MIENTREMWYVYKLQSPIDIGWEFMLTLSQFLDSSKGEDGESLSAFANSEWLSALNVARFCGFDGTFTDKKNEPHLLPVPWSSDVVILGFVFKQENNGDTFVISPVSLEHLNRFLVDTFLSDEVPVP